MRRAMQTLDRIVALAALHRLSTVGASVEYRYRFVTEPAADYLLRLAGRTRSPFAVGGLAWGSEQHQDQVVLVKPSRKVEWDFGWMTPGGKVEGGESVLSALNREMVEEVGLRPLHALLTTLHENCYTDGEQCTSHFYFQFRMQLEGGPLVSSGKDVEQPRWFDTLPHDLGWRADYLRDFAAGPPATGHVGLEHFIHG